MGCDQLPLDEKWKFGGLVLTLVLFTPFMIFSIKLLINHKFFWYPWWKFRNDDKLNH